MSLRTRNLLWITTLLVVTVAVTSGVAVLITRQALLDQTRQDGIVIAELLARSASFARQVPNDVEDAIGEQMIIQATIAAHLVAVAEEEGIPPEQINEHLIQIAETTALDEFWITDESGFAYLRNIDVDFTFSPDPDEQPQAHVFWTLIDETEQSVVQEARVREIDTQVYKYVGVGGVDQPRIVQVGYNAQFIEGLRQQVGLNRLIDELVSGGDVQAIRVVDDETVTLAYSALSGNTDEAIGTEDGERVNEVMQNGTTSSYVDGQTLKVFAPIEGMDGESIGAVVVALPTDKVRHAMNQALLYSAGLTLIMVAIGVIASMILSQYVTSPILNLTKAAADIEADKFDIDLSVLSERKDELGQLARVFSAMAHEVYKREESLKQQVAELRIEIDQSKREAAVSEITETEYFHELQQKAKEIRNRKQDEK